MTEKLFKTLIVAGAIFIALLIVVTNSCTVISPTERGIMVTLGVADDDVLEPGLKFKAPFISSVLTYDLTPIQYESAFNNVADAAITSDKQSILVNFELFWKYDEMKLYDVATRYKTKESLYQPISTSLKGIIKDIVGKMSIDNIVADQGNLTRQVKDRLIEETSYLPIIIDKFTITNIDWSAEYDKQIEETAKLRQQVEQAKQQALIVEAQAQKQVKEAQAKLEAQKLEAESIKVAAEGKAAAKLAEANGAAEAKKKEADALAYYNAKVAQNYQVEIKLKELEIQLERAKNWNGKEVPDYIPLTAAGGVVNLNK